MRNYFRMLIAALVLFAAGMVIFICCFAKGNAADTVYASARVRLIIGTALVGILLFLAAFLYGMWLDKKFAKPFKEMKIFAERIAGGNFDDTEGLDKNNMFGPFAESYDIMRGELTRSREREMTLKENESELIATLGHDMKDPVTGIRLASELIRTKITSKKDLSDDDKYILDKVEKIYDSADGLDVLLNDLFTSALDELGESRVNCADVESRVLEDIVKKYDDRKLVTSSSIPYVLIHIDVRCMNRVIGSIINNSYRYANTPIDVGYLMLDDFLQMKITDHGPGIAADELPLVTNKYYRSRLGASSNEEGSGLGLYTAKKLMEKMNGDLLIENTGDGLAVTLLIRLS